MADYDLGRAEGRVEIDTSGVRKATADMSTFSGTMSKSLQTVGSKMTSAGRTMTTHVTLPLLGIAAAGIKTASDFEKSMNTMAAVAQVPAAELAKLRKLAIDLGAKTVFSANEAAQAQLELAKAGISVSDIMGGALANTLDLATAGDLDLATAATVAANAMNVFGLSGKESKEAVDALAGAANASSADVDDLAQALSQGGLAAANAGFSIQETTAILGAFAQNGLRGSDAGTSLKTMLISLVPSTDRAREAMKKYGLDFIDAQGAIKDAPAVFDELHDKLGDVSQAEQQLALKTIFGTDAFRAAIIATKLGSDGLEVYTDATNKSGTASEVAAGKMEGLPGVLERLKGTFETFLLTVGDRIAPVVEQLAEEIGKLLTAFTDLPKPMQEMILKALAVAAVMGPLLRIFGPMVSLVGKLGGLYGGLATNLGKTASQGAAAQGALGSMAGTLKSLGTGALIAGGTILAGQFIRNAIQAANWSPEDVANKLVTPQQVEQISEQLNSKFGHLSLTEINPFKTRFDITGDAVKVYGETLKEAVKAGIPMEEAQRRLNLAFDDLVPTLGGVNGNMDTWRENLRQSIGLTVDADGVTRIYSQSLLDTSQAQATFGQIVGFSAEQNTKAGNKLAALVNGYTNMVGPIDSTTTAMLNNLVQMGDYQAAIKLLNDELNKNTRGMLHNLEVTNRHAGAEREADAAQRQRGASMAATTEQTQRAGEETNAYKRYLDSLPKSVRTQVIAETEAARRAIEQVATSLNGLPSTKVINIQLNREGWPGRASGGPVERDAPYIIGEQGPELFIPWTSGRVIPNHVVRSVSRQTDRMEHIATSHSGQAVGSSKGMRISGTLQTPFGPSHIDGMIEDAIGEHEGFNRRLARMKHS